MVRVAVISDTHLLHRDMDMGQGDLLIHCGDMLDLFSGEQEQDLSDIDDWFGTLDFRQIICIGGNHDLALQATLQTKVQPFRNAHYLHDDGIEFDGLRIYGSPSVPDLPGHAFYADPGELAAAWQGIPDGLDILVTHAPPAGILDQSRSGRSLGCPMLARRVAEAAPRLHCFGHVHASAGQQRVGVTHYVNASSQISGTRTARAPIWLEIAQ